MRTKDAAPAGVDDRQPVPSRRLLPSFAGVFFFCSFGAGFTDFACQAVTACQNGRPAQAGSGPATPPAAAEDRESAARFPWKTGETFRYLWNYERRRVGTTEFSIDDLEREKERNPVPAARYRIRSRFEYERDGTSRRSDVESLFDARWSLLRFRTRTRLDTVRDIRSHQESEGWLEGSKLLVDVTGNRDPANRVRTELDLPEGARVIVPQAVEIWAVLLAGLPRGRELPALPLAYPEFGKVYSVEFEYVGAEEIEHRGSPPVPCRRFRFRSDDGQLKGEIWIDGSGRMLRYEQGPLRVTLEPPAAGGGEKESAEKGAKGNEPGEKGKKE